MPFDNATYRPIPEGHRRLLVLAEFLETEVPDNRFNIARWCESHDFETCGTAACACGWATTIPEFKALGFALRQHANAPEAHDLVFGGAENMVAASHFFDISVNDAENFFYRISYDRMRGRPIRKDEVIARLRTFVAEQAKVLA